MIVFACGFSHESHGFSSRLTHLNDFADAEPGSIENDPDLGTTRSVEGGILCAARELNWDLRFPFSARATPAGPLTTEAFETLTERLLTELKKQGRVDGILLTLHGAMAAENCPDCEGEILERVRGIVGFDVPIGLPLDPHTNFTDRMARLATISTSHRTTPHVDQWETAYRAACMLDDAMRGKTRPRVFVSRLPMLAGMDMGRTLDPDGPMSRLQKSAREIEREDPGVLDIALNAGYYYGDVFEAGPSVTVTGNGEDSRYADIAGKLMLAAWETRGYVSIKHVSVDEAIARTRTAHAGKGPIILADYTDGPMGGAHGDGTRLLIALLAENAPGTVVGPIYDPVAAASAVAAGVNASVSLPIGGIGDQEYGGPPVTVSGVVASTSDGVYVRKGPYATGSVGHCGTSARIQSGNVSVIVVSERVQPEDREQYRIFGIDPESVNILACKGINHFRADFEPIAREVIFVDTGGLVSVDFTRFPFKHVRRPIWPLDPDVTLP
jgi:microcystin degradation protein MlrC